MTPTEWRHELKCIISLILDEPEIPAASASSYLNVLLQNTEQTISLIQGEAGNWCMKNPISIGKMAYGTALMLPVICLVAFTGCSSLDATAGNQTAKINRVGAYLQQNQEKPDNDPVDPDPDPTYEWFY